MENTNGASLRNYTYDDAFRITGIADAANSALSWTYGYDSLDRLNAASKSSTTQGWTYDANGNRLTLREHLLQVGGETNTSHFLIQADS